MDNEVPASARAIARYYKDVEREAIACPLCGSEPHQHIIALSDDVFSMKLRTVVCARCALVFTNPRLKGYLYKQFYERDYHVLYSEVREPDPAYITRRHFDAVADFRVEYYREFLRDDMRLLEIGSGPGTFLSVVRKRFTSAKVLGLEPSPRFAEYTRRVNGASVVVSPIEGAPGAARGCDVVAMFHVLEHLVNPLGVLTSIGEGMKPGGVLLLEVPNVLGTWWGIGMFHIAHTCVFGPRTLRRLVERAGFKIERCDDRNYRGLESSVFLVARQDRAAATHAREAWADASEIRHTVAWIRRHCRGASIGRLKKRLLLGARALRDLMKVAVGSGGPARTAR